MIAQPPDPDAKLRRRTILIALLGPLVTWVSGVLIVAGLSSPTLTDGQCEGLGWGCTLTPRDTALLLGLLGGIVGVPIATIIGALLLLVPMPHRFKAVTTNALIGAPVVVLIAAALLQAR